MEKIISSVRKYWRGLPFAGVPKPLVTHLRLQGTIGAGGNSRLDRTNLHLAGLEKAIDNAFAPEDLKAVILSINSPGGSPVQSRLIHDRIREKAAEKDVPVLSFVEDVGASGGFILAIAGDEVFADESSIIGSIGVIAGGFGFPELLKKAGIERRIHTAGGNKSQLDPFRAEKAEDVKRLQVSLDVLHGIFIDLVRARRAGKLASDDQLFSGEFWPAGRARELGLIDEIGAYRPVAKARFGEDVVIRKISVDDRGLLQRLLSRYAPAPPAAALSLPVDPDAVMGAMERRALWGRFGL